MRHIIKTFCLLWTLFSLALPRAFASNAQFQKEKTGEITFNNVKSGSKLKLSNSFGHITLIVWKNNSIKLQYKMEAKAESQSDAEKLLKSMAVVQEENGINYSLVFTRNEQDNNNGKQRSIESTWVIYIPESRLSINVHNSFGDIYIPNYKCENLRAQVRFGTLKCETLEIANECSLEAMHGNLLLNKTYKAKVQASFSNVSVGVCNQLNLQSKHCQNVTINGSDRLTLYDAFSTINIGKLTDGHIKLQHSKLYTDKALGQTSLTCQHSTINVLQAGNLVTIPNSQHSRISINIVEAEKFEGFSMNGAFTQLSLSIPKKINAGYKLKTQFGSIKISSDIKHKNTYVEEKNFYNSYEGYFGTSANAPVLVEIENQHGNIDID